MGKKKIISGTGETEAERLAKKFARQADVACKHAQQILAGNEEGINPDKVTAFKDAANEGYEGGFNQLCHDYIALENV